MSYLTVEVEIDHGRIVAKEPDKLPVKGSALLTILSGEGAAKMSPRPFGLAKGEFVVPDDFNAPLPEETLRGFEGK
jgi:hypothetical protein